MTARSESGRYVVDKPLVWVLALALGCGSFGSGYLARPAVDPSVYVSEAAFLDKLDRKLEPIKKQLVQISNQNAATSTEISNLDRRLSRLEERN